MCANNSRGYGEDKLGQIFGNQVFGNSVVAIVSGLAAQGAAELFPFSGGPTVFFGGYTSPFDLASLILIFGALIMSMTWEENYGDRQAGNSVFSVASLKSAGAVIKNDKKVLLCGLIQSLFEGSMYSFVFEWTPAISTDVGSETPYGIIFATFMVCCMGGSQIYSRLIQTRKPHAMLPLIFAVSAAALALVPFDYSFGTQYSYFGFLIFEVCVGMYFPLMSTVKSQVVPENFRSTIYNIFRVPLNAIVLFVLLNNFSIALTFGICSGMLLSACVLQIVLNSMLNSASPVVAYSEVKNVDQN